MAPANFSLLLFVLSIIDVAVIFAAPVPAFASKGPVVLTQTAELARGSSLKLTMSGAGRSKEGKMNNMQSPSLYRMYKVASIKPSYLESMSTLSPAEYYLGRSASNESEKPQDMPLKSVNKMVNDELSKETKPVKKISSEKPNASRAPLDRKTVVGGALALAAVAILDRKFHSEPEEAEVEIAEEPKGGLFAWRSRGQQEEEPEEDGNKVLAATMQVGGAALNTAKVVASTTWTVGKVTAQAAWMAASGLMMVGKFVSQVSAGSDLVVLPCIFSAALCSDTEHACTEDGRSNSAGRQRAGGGGGEAFRGPHCAGADRAGQHCPLPLISGAKLKSRAVVYRTFQRFRRDCET